MKKMIKKALAAVVTATMVMGMMAMSAFAADAKDVTVHVTWTEAAGADVSLWAWDTADNSNLTGGVWPGQVMTANADGTYSLTLKDVAADEIKVIASIADGQTEDSEGLSTSTGYIEVTVGAKGDSKYAITAEAKEAPTADDGNRDTEGGVADFTALYAVVAVVAGATVVVSKKRRVEA